MKRKHDELSSLAIKSLVCETADEYAGLPILWHGQEVGEVGPIEPLPEHVKQEPHSLQQGFHWINLHGSYVQEAAKFLEKRASELTSTECEHENVIYEQIINFYLTYPNISNWQFGIQATSGKIVGTILATPKHMCIGKEMKEFVKVILRCHKKYENKRLKYMLIKELMRRAKLNKINQLILPSTPLLKPVTTFMLWTYNFNQLTSAQLPSSPRTPGWRRMTSEDVPSALALINKWSSQFEIREVFNSEEEFSHNFVFQRWVFSYVVADKSNNLTDLVNFMLYDVPQAVASITTVASTKSPVKQLIIDALVCAKENGASAVTVHQHNIESDILASLSFLPSEYQTYHFYNYIDIMKFRKLNTGLFKCAQYNHNIVATILLLL